MRVPMPSPVTDCCGARRQLWQDDGGAREGTCKDCQDVLCTSCAALWEDDYSLEGESYRWCGLSLCRVCRDDRDARAVNNRLGG